MTADFLSDPQPSIEAARIAAQATVQAAQIAADATRINTLISVAGTLIALIGTVIAAYVAYKNAREPLRRADIASEKEKSVLLAQLQTTVRAAITTVDQVLETYRGDFSEPVEVRVLPMPAIFELRDVKEFAALGAAINEAITLVGLRLNDYRRAKAPIQDRNRSPGDNKPVMLKERPDDFDAVVAAAEDYRTALNRLEGLVSRMDS